LRSCTSKEGEEKDWVVVQAAAAAAVVVVVVVAAAAEVALPRPAACSGSTLARTSY
jgi:hypothetical protein